MINYIYKEGQTPINEDEKNDLIPELSTQEELNKWEQENILEAQKWLLGKSLTKSNIFDSTFLKELHNKMFNKTWRWAGTYRKTNKNIGCKFYQIDAQVKELKGDTTFWLQNKTYSIKQLALVYHHRLVKIHLFPNGNGRHSRLMADLIIKKYQGQNLEWQNKNFKSFDDFRKEYISSLRKADHCNYQNLFNLFD